MPPFQGHLCHPTLSWISPPSPFSNHLLLLLIYNDTFTSKLLFLKSSDNTEYLKKREIVPFSLLLPLPPHLATEGRDVVCPALCWSSHPGQWKGTGALCEHLWNKWTNYHHQADVTLLTLSHIYSVFLYINGSTPYVLYTGFFSFCFIMHLRGLPLTLYLDLLHSFSLLTRGTVIIRPLPYWQAFRFLPFLTISSHAPAQAVVPDTQERHLRQTQWMEGLLLLFPFLKTRIFLKDKLDRREILFLGSGGECQP